VKVDEADRFYEEDEDPVNRHTYGIPNANALVFHLHKTEDGDMATGYLDSFERLWVGSASFG
jgi:hypothetical protein